MTTFDFFSASRIVFGAGQFARVGELSQPLGSRALIVFNGDESLAARAAAHLISLKIEAHVFRQRGEPTVGDVDRACEAARQLNADLILGLGGGSAIDAGKAVAGLVANGGSALDYMEVIGQGRKLTRPSLPWIAIPTTFGTGAEATRNAVIGAPAKGHKASIRGEQLLPRIALVDPELGANVPRKVVAQSGMDALCQLIESYTSNGATPITDALVMAGLGLGAKALPRAYSDPSDAAARSDMALAALLSGMTLSNAGLGAVHGFAAPLGANFPVPHGAACAALLPPVVEANIIASKAASPAHPVLARYATLARVMGADTGDESAALGFMVQRLYELQGVLNIEPLSAFGINPADVDRIVGLARKASSMRFNPVILGDDALAGILHRAVAGA